MSDHVLPREPSEAATFKGFSALNRARCEAANGFNHQLASWSLSDWFTAILGELGEAANVAKKLNRIRDGIPGNKQTEPELRAMLRREIADAFIYLDLTAQAAGFTLGDAVLEVFDAKSQELGYPVRAAYAIDGGAPTCDPLSSDWLDALHEKRAQGQCLTDTEQDEMLEAHRSLLEAYHSTVAVRGGAAERAGEGEVAALRARVAGLEAAAWAVWRTADVKAEAWVILGRVLAEGKDTPGSVSRTPAQANVTDLASSDRRPASDLRVHPSEAAIEAADRVVQKWLAANEDHYTRNVTRMVLEAAYAIEVRDALNRVFEAASEGEKK